MNTYIALLRGINVGGRNSLTMVELKAILEKLTLKNIRTYIQSGNVVFQSKKKLAKSYQNEIADAIDKAKGFRPSIILLTQNDFESAIEGNNFDTSNGKILHLFFMQDAVTEVDTEKLNRLKADSEEFDFTDSVFYLYAPDGIGKSKLGRGIEKALGVPLTARNWNTVEEIKNIIAGF